ncbi:hypothetical protein BX616_004531, partial [Lobosporangium transversale]
MASSGTTNQLRQAFQFCTPSGQPYHSDIVRLNVCKDIETGEHFVLWKDIQHVFSNVQHIQHGNKTVLFQTDKNGQFLEPQRIQYHCGVVLDAIVGPSAPLHGTTISDITPAASPKPTSLDLTSLEIEALAIQDINLDPHPSFYNHEIPDSFPQPSEKKDTTINSSICEGVNNGKEIVEQLLDDHHGVISHNKTEQYTMAEIQKRMGKTQQQQRKTTETTDLTPKEALQVQHHRHFQAPKCPDIIYSRIHSIISQTHEPHRDPTPRLFIVLPKSNYQSYQNNNALKPFSYQFKVYFICECGAHTMTNTNYGATLNETHLVNHPGYDLDRPEEFFERYGPYVLVMLQMVKYGYRSAETIVPPLAHCGMVKEMDCGPKYLKATASAFGSLIDWMIEYIQKQIEAGSKSLETQSDTYKEFKSEDLQELECHLIMRDDSRTPGNLYRMITDEGHSKWVCRDHYANGYRAWMITSLARFVEVYNGSYLEEVGKIEIALTSRDMARQFYDAMVKASSVVELNVSWDWDATAGDLQEFATAVTKANVTVMSLDGSGLLGKGMDMTDRFRPIVQLLCNGRIQSMSLISFEKFFDCTDTTSMTSAPKLRRLFLGTGVLKTVSSIFALRNVLAHCPSLADLVICGLVPGMVLESFVGHNSLMVQTLNTLELRYNTASLQVNYFQGEPVESAMKITELAEGFERHLPIFETGQLTHLSIVNHVSAGSYQWLPLILMKNPKMVSLSFEGCTHCFDLFGTVLRTRDQIISWTRSCALKTVRFWNSKWSMSNFIMEVKFPDPLDPYNLLIDIDMLQYSEDVGRDGRRDMIDLLGHYGALVNDLTMSPAFNDEMAQVLDESTQEEGSSLRGLLIDCTSLTMAGLDYIDRIIERSKGLEQLRLRLSNLADKEQQERCKRLVKSYASRLNGLTRVGDAIEIEWTPELAQWLPLRQDLPELQVFDQPFAGEVSSECVQWIANMIGAHQGPKTFVNNPNRLVLPSSLLFSTPSPLSLSCTGSSFPTQESTAAAARTLGEIDLSYLRIKPESWRILIHAIDFSTLEILHLDHTNFDLELFKVLVDSIPTDNGTGLCLKALNIHETHLNRYVPYLVLSVELKKRRSRKGGKGRPGVTGAASSCRPYGT